MRMASFLLGGVVGAAAVVYVSRNSDKIWSGMIRMAGSASQMMSKSNAQKNTLTTSPSGSTTGQSTAPAAKSANPNASYNGKAKAQTMNPSMAEVEEIVNKDPQLKATVQEIITHNQSQKSDFNPIRS